MPALSECRPHARAVGISIEALRQILENRNKRKFVNVARCLRYPAKQMLAPSRDEGFAELYRVAIRDDGAFDVTAVS